MSQTGKSQSVLWCTCKQNIDYQKLLHSNKYIKNLSGMVIFNDTVMLACLYLT